MVRSLKLTCLAAASTVAPQAKTISRAWSFFFRCLSAIGLPPNHHPSTQVSCAHSLASGPPLTPINAQTDDRRLARCLLAAEQFESVDYYVAVQRIEFHQVGATVQLLGGDQRGPRTAEEVEDVF